MSSKTRARSKLLNNLNEEGTLQEDNKARSSKLSEKDESRRNRSKTKTAEVDTTCLCGEPWLPEETSIACDDCGRWWHTRPECTGASPATLKALLALKTSKFTCPLCITLNITSPNIKSKLLQNHLASQDQETTKAETLVDTADTAAAELNLSTEVDEATTTRKISKEDAAKEGADSANKPDPDNYEKPNPELIVILDSNFPGKFRNSREIQRVITQHKPSIQYHNAYSLHLGGVAICCKDEESKLTALDPWPKEAFDYAEVNPHSPASVAKQDTDAFELVARNLPSQKHDQLLCENIKREYKAETGSKSCSIRRFFNKSQNKYMPVAEIVIDSAVASNHLIKSGIKVNNAHVCFEPKRKAKIVRCYNCQKFGHAAHQCSNDPVCVNCGNDPTSTDHICHSHKCANCSKQHPASSKHCETYKRLLSTTNRHSIITNQHAHALPQH